MDHLVAFLPESIALGATGALTVTEARKLPSWSKEREQQMKLAKELTTTLLGNPEPGDRELPSSSNKHVDWKKDYNIRDVDAHNLERPETIESLFMMYRITEYPMYREWRWKMFQSFQKYGLVDDGEGYTSLADVRITPPRQADNIESF